MPLAWQANGKAQARLPSDLLRAGLRPAMEDEHEDRQRTVDVHDDQASDASAQRKGRFARRACGVGVCLIVASIPGVMILGIERGTPKSCSYACGTPDTPAGRLILGGAGGEPGEPVLVLPRRRFPLSDAMKLGKDGEVPTGREWAVPRKRGHVHPPPPADPDASSPPVPALTQGLRSQVPS